VNQAPTKLSQHRLVGTHRLLINYELFRSPLRSRVMSLDRSRGDIVQLISDAVAFDLDMAPG
jgi:hypothetical protein